MLRQVERGRRWAPAATQPLRATASSAAGVPGPRQAPHRRAAELRSGRTASDGTGRGGASSCAWPNASHSSARSGAERANQVSVSSDGGVLLDALAADGAPGRLHREHAAERGRAHRGPGGLRAERQGHVAVRHRGGRPGGRPAGRAPRVARGWRVAARRPAAANSVVSVLPRMMAHRRCAGWPRQAASSAGRWPSNRAANCAASACRRCRSRPSRRWGRRAGDRAAGALSSSRAWRSTAGGVDVGPGAHRRVPRGHAVEAGAHGLLHARSGRRRWRPTAPWR